MISAAIQAQARVQPDRLALEAGEVRLSYGELATRAVARASELVDLRRARVGLVGGAVDRCAIDLLALESLGAQVTLVPPAALPERARLCAHAQVHVLLDETGRSRLTPHASAVAEPGLVLFTSGTSGPPKPALHTWESLARRVRSGPRWAGKSWLLGYDLTRFAGVQVLLQALLSAGTLVRPTSAGPRAAWEALARGAQIASGSPSWWRALLRDRDAAQTVEGVEQITLGGEAVDQPLLDALQQVFPRARVTQIYASTELGALFSVHDGQAGFPRSLMTGPEARLALGPDGQLLARPGAGAMRGYLDERALAEEEWFATGDWVEVRGERCYFVGRGSEVINVGGRKVYPLRVEDVIRALEGVADVRVSGLPSSVLGELVSAEVQLAAGADPEQVRERVLSECRAVLAKFEVPALVKVSGADLALTPAGKAARGASAGGSP